MPHDPFWAPYVWRYSRRRFYTPDTWRRLSRLLLADRDRSFCIGVAWARLTRRYLVGWWRAAMLLLVSSRRPTLLTEMPERILHDIPEPERLPLPPPQQPSSSPSRTTRSLGPQTAHRYRCIAADARSSSPTPS